jgi:hypothetical protein
MIDWLEDWLLRLGFLNPEGLMARAALCAEDNQKLARGNLFGRANYAAVARSGLQAQAKAKKRAQPSVNPNFIR